MLTGLLKKSSNMLIELNCVGISVTTLVKIEVTTAQLRYLTLSHCHTLQNNAYAGSATFSDIVDFEIEEFCIDIY